MSGRPLLFTSYQSDAAMLRTRVQWVWLVVGLAFLTWLPFVLEQVRQWRGQPDRGRFRPRDGGHARPQGPRERVRQIGGQPPAPESGA